jgi:hypothetical protein
LKRSQFQNALNKLREKTFSAFSVGSYSVGRRTVFEVAEKVRAVGQLLFSTGVEGLLSRTYPLN